MSTRPRPSFTPTFHTSAGGSGDSLLRCLSRAGPPLPTLRNSTATLHTLNELKPGLSVPDRLSIGLSPGSKNSLSSPDSGWTKTALGGRNGLKRKRSSTLEPSGIPKHVKNFIACRKIDPNLNFVRLDPDREAEGINTDTEDEDFYWNTDEEDLNEDETVTSQDQLPFSSLQPETQPSTQTISENQKPILDDALSYLSLVRSVLPDQYHIFLDIMKDFKSGVIDTPGVIERVKELFSGYNDLKSKFNNFLPPGHTVPNDESTTLAGTSPRYSNGEPVVTQLHALSLKDAIPAADFLRAVLYQTLSVLENDDLFINHTISEDMTGVNGSELKARLCALRDGAPGQTRRFLRRTA